MTSERTSSLKPKATTLRNSNPMILDIGISCQKQRLFILLKAAKSRGYKKAHTGIAPAKC